MAEPVALSLSSVLLNSHCYKKVLKKNLWLCLFIGREGRQAGPSPTPPSVRLSVRPSKIRPSNRLKSACVFPPLYLETNAVGKANGVFHMHGTYF